MLPPFLEGQPPAMVQAYPAEAVIAEKVETLLKRFPVIQHRLKDLLDVVVLAERLEFDGPTLLSSLRATFARRITHPDKAALEDMGEVLRGRSWERDWATMVREKAVANAPELRDAVAAFELFVQPVLHALGGEPAPGRWPPGGPWSSGD